MPKSACFHVHIEQLNIFEEAHAHIINTHAITNTNTTHGTQMHVIGHTHPCKSSAACSCLASRPPAARNMCKGLQVRRTQHKASTNSLSCIALGAASLFGGMWTVYTWLCTHKLKNTVANVVQAAQQHGSSGSVLSPVSADH